ncbi:MAG: hypothetical protein AVDCRST_MAG10-2772, partial [uncultured Acidimicrobiales bacterium]
RVLGRPGLDDGPAAQLGHDCRQIGRLGHPRR